MDAVVYKIVNVVNDAFYIGSTLNHRRRQWEHLDQLKRGVHHCKRLQEAYDVFGRDAFIFEVVQVVEPDRLGATEDMYLSQFAGAEGCYNTATSTDAPSYAAETRAKISESLKRTYAVEGHPRTGTTHTEATKALISTQRTGKGAGSKHYRYGQTLDAAVREKIGATQRGVPKGSGRQVSAAGMEKIRAAAAAGHYSHWEGREHTAEAKEKMAKPLIAIDPSGTETQYPSITAFRAATGLLPSTINNALKSGKPLARGPYKGWCFRYFVAIPIQLGV